MHQQLNPCFITDYKNSLAEIFHTYVFFQCDEILSLHVVIRSNVKMTVQCKITSVRATKYMQKKMYANLYELIN